MFERLRERRPRWGCVGASLVLAPALACCLGSAVGVVVPPSPVDQAPGEEAFARELAVAEGVGLTVRQSETLDTAGDEYEFEVPVAAGECVAFLATAWGYVEVVSLRLSEADEWLSTDNSRFGMVGHAQYCAPSDMTLTASVGLQHQDTVLGRETYSSGTLRYAVLVGRPPAGTDSLNRGNLTPTARGRMTQSEILGIADRLAEGRTPWGPPLPVASYRARLVPETVAAYEHVRALARNESPDDVTPRLDLLPVDAPAAWRPLASEAAYPIPAGDEGTASAPAMAFDDRTPVRVLAVVDADAIGRCVDVQLTRNVWGSETAARRRVPSGAPPDSSTREGNVMSDRLCAGRATYVTDGRDQVPYLLRIYTETGAPQAGQVPSSAGNGALQ